MDRSNLDASNLLDNTADNLKVPHSDDEMDDAEGEGSDEEEEV